MSLWLGQEVQALSRRAELSADSSVPREPVDVVVGILVDGRQRVLIAQRPAGKPMAGAWEFPGGKREPHESPVEALHRELREELGVAVVDAEPLMALEHAYPDMRVRLDVWWVSRYRHEPDSIEQQALRWVSAAELGATAMLPADGPIVDSVIERLLAGG